MKKTLLSLLLALAPVLFAFSSTKHVWYGGYRIGQQFIAYDGKYSRVSELPYTLVNDSDSCELTAAKVSGQKIMRWNVYAGNDTWYDNGKQVFGNVYSCEYKYSTSSFSEDVIVVDYDWITYNLIYNANGGSGSLPSSRSNIIYTNEVVVASDSLPARTGYTWSGWTNNLTTTVWQGGETVTGESLGLRSIVDGSTVVLRAKWTPHTYAVEFDANTYDSVSGTMAPMALTYDVATNLSANAFVRAGYRFTGWATKTDGTKTYDDEDEVKNLASDKGAAVTLYAVWSAKNFSIRYHRNDGTGTSTVQTGLSYGTLVEMPSIVEREGYTLQGWSTAETGNVEYEVGKKYPIDPGDLDTIQLYAVWAAKKYSVTFDSNGGDGTMDGVALDYGATYIVPECAFSKAQVAFTGWTTNLAVSAEFKPGDAVSNLTATAGATVTFYAVWSEPRYIAFDGNGADNPDAMDIVAFDGIETNALPRCEFTKAGYTFDGWATNAVAATNLVVVYEDEANVISTNLWMGIGETNVFYAVWQTNAYTVVFNANGGTDEMADQTFVYDQAQPLSKCTFSSSLMFRGWATNETGDVVWGDEVSVSNLTAEAYGSVNLFAVWDNGNLSKAMHCSNLYWEPDGSGDNGQWIPVVGPNEGYNPSGSVVSNEIGSALSGTSASYVLKPRSALQTAGLLSFRYKMSNTERNNQLVVQMADEETNLAASTEWQQFGPVSIASNAEVRIQYKCATTGFGAKRHSVWIDQMTWMPGGAEPTDADRPTINGFTAKDGGFTLSVDGGNISDLFNYQILATNELVKGDWPVKETLTADELKAGYEIGIEENEPKMFYKVNVVPKQ